MAAPYRHIACCVEESDASQRALAEARRLRSLGHGRLSLVHVNDPPTFFAGHPASALLHRLPELPELARQWLRSIAHPGEETVLLEGYPPKAVCEWAERAGCDLVVSAAHRGRVERAFLGSFAGYVAYHAPCPVLLVRPVPPG